MFRYGKILIDQYAAFKGAEAEINERILCIESNWKRTVVQLQFLRDIYKTLDEEHQNIQSQVLRVLANKLEMAIFQIQRVQERKGKGNAIGARRWKYVLVKECLDKVIQDLES
jgi:hypothetical protein